MKRLGQLMALPLAALTLLVVSPVRADEPAYVHDAAQDHVGRVHYYVRSNSDGSMPEQVSVYRASPTRIEVSKWIGPCAGAALVSAELDFDTWSAERLTGGRLLPEAQVMEFAFLQRDAETGVLNVAVNLPDQALAFEAIIPGTPWHLYDFDLASLTALLPYRADAEADITFDMALVWSDPSHPEPVSRMGDVRLVFAGREARNGHETLRFDTTGDTLGGGSLWLDAAEGYVVEAVFGAPNHPGYTDFQLRLTGVEEIGQQGWTDYLAAHYANCEE